METLAQTVVDEWEVTWTWARKVWGDNTDYSFNDFFRGIARERAKEEGLEEVGSSDVWHISYSTVKQIKALGTIETRLDLEIKVREYMGCN